MDYIFRKERLQSYSVPEEVNKPVHWTLYTIIPVFSQTFRSGKTGIYTE